jgi:hypothetical protein
MKKFSLPALALTALFLTTACERTPVAPEQPTTEPAQQDASVSAQQDASVSSIPCQYPDNCVLQARYARAYLRVSPSLPYGLTSYAQKRDIINRTSNPRVGSVAICNQGNSIGHVAVVTRVRGSGSGAIVTLHEANYGSVRCRNDRSGTAAQLRITGYFY